MLPNRRFFILVSLFLSIFFLARAQSLEIWQIQGSSNDSPYVGQLVSTNGNIVTAVGTGFFFLQTPPARSDNDPTTSDGVFVYTQFSHGLSPGQVVNVMGRVGEVDGTTEISGPGLEVMATGLTAPLPVPVELTLDFPSALPAVVYDLERVEGMRVAFNADVVGPSHGSNNEAALALATQRPFREPGIAYPGLNNLPIWDGNPEIIWFDPDVLNQPDNRFLSFGQQVAATAVVYQRAEGSYFVFPTAYSVSGSRFERDVRPPAADEFTIGSLNVLQLVIDNSALATKYQKTARYIVDRMAAPDVLALQEVGDLSVLNDLVAAIHSYRSDVVYSPYLLPGNNNTSVNSAFLVRQRLRDVAVVQLGSQENVSTGGRLHDRPPLLLTANLPTDPPVPIQVLNLHLRSLNGIEDGSFVKRKRYEQALSVARMVQERQTANLIVVGDFNAFPFTDGYVDVLGIISGVSGGDAEFPGASIVSPPLQNMAEAEIAVEQYSYVYEGAAQLLDHCLTNGLEPALQVRDFEFARGNADAAAAFASNPVLATRTSDHDGFVLYLATDATIVSTVQPWVVADWVLPNPVRAGAALSLPGGTQTGDVQIYTLGGQLLGRATVSGGVFHWPALPAGAYLLRCAGHARVMMSE